MRPAAVLNYLGFIAYTAFVLVAICSPWQWKTGDVTITLLAIWLIYGIISNVWIQSGQQIGSRNAWLYFWAMRRF